MAIILEQIDGTIRTYEEALRKNLLNDKEKKECLEKIANLKKMKNEFLRKNKK